jgi:hypothetical protein
MTQNGTILQQPFALGWLEYRINEVLNKLVIQPHTIDNAYTCNLELSANKQTLSNRQLNDLTMSSLKDP